MGAVMKNDSRQPRRTISQATSGGVKRSPEAEARAEQGVGQGPPSDGEPLGDGARRRGEQRRLHGAHQEADSDQDREDDDRRGRPSRVRDP